MFRVDGSREIWRNSSIHDKTFPDIPDVGVDRVMCHSSSMVQRLLVRIETLDAKYTFCNKLLVKKV